MEAKQRGAKLSELQQKYPPMSQDAKLKRKVIYVYENEKKEGEKNSVLANAG